MDSHSRPPYGAVVGARRHGLLLLVALSCVAAVALRLDGIADPSVEQRETQSALLVRQWALGDGAQLSESRHAVLDDLDRLVRPIEPPLLELVTWRVWNVLGEEPFWVPRILSAVLWSLGGLFLFRVARRLTTTAGAVVALAFYLVWPYGVLLSRMFMPDALLVCLLLAGTLALIRYAEQPSRWRFAAAGLLAGAATLAKPGVALLPLVGLAVALAVARGELHASVQRGTLPLFVLLAAAPALVYYVVGAHLSDFIWSGAGARRLTPDLLLERSFWSGWWDMVSFLVRYPQPQQYLALLPLLAGLCGLVLAKRGLPRATLVGLTVGYIAFALSFANYTSTHPYYSLMLIPLLALAIGVAAGRAFEFAGRRNRRAGWAVAAVVTIVVVVAVQKNLSVLGSENHEQLIGDYERIGQLTEHTTRAIVVDDRLSTPLMYWGWIVGEAWELDYNSEPPSWIDVEAAEYLVVVGTHQLATSDGLRRFVRGRPVVARTARLAIYDLRSL